MSEELDSNDIWVSYSHLTPRKITELLYTFKNISPERRGRVILVLDEFDKLLASQYGSGGTNYSEMVQNQIVRLCNHDTLIFANESDGGFSVDTTGVKMTAKICNPDIIGMAMDVLPLF